MGERLSVLTAGDGRSLGVAQWGDLDGTPVLSLHGTPGSRLTHPQNEDAVTRAGLRVITYDRPGYGASDRAPGRRVVDCVGDVETIVDALGIDRFAVIGRSGGGSHALAVAARLPQRVIRAECVVGAAPFDTPGLQWTGGMDPENVEEFAWAGQGEQVLHRELTRIAEEDLARLKADPAQAFSPDWHLAEADREILARTDVQQVFHEATQEAYRTGVWGWVDDDLAFLKPWGFEVGEIAVPVTIRFGRQDVLVPAAHGEWLGQNVPGADVAVDEEAGHLVSPELQLERMVLLAQGRGPAS